MIATIATIVAIAAIAEKNSSAIAAIDGFHMIAAIATIAEKVNEDRGDLGLTISFRLILEIQHSGCELFLKFVVKTVASLHFFHKKGQIAPFEGAYAVHHGIFAVAAIAAIAGEWFPYDRYDRGDRITAIAAIVVAAIAVIATIAGEWFPYDRYDRGTFFSAIAAIAAIVAIVAIIWKPGLTQLFHKTSRNQTHENISSFYSSVSETQKRKLNEKVIALRLFSPEKLTS